MIIFPVKKHKKFSNPPRIHWNSTIRYLSFSFELTFLVFMNKETFLKKVKKQPFFVC